MYRYLKINTTTTIVSMLVFFAIVWILSAPPSIQPRSQESRSHVHSDVRIPHEYGRFSKVHTVSSLQESVDFDPPWTSIKDLLNSNDLENIDTEKGKDYLAHIKTDCSDSICSQFLTSANRPHFKYCVQKTWKLSVDRFKEPAQSTCVFVSGENRFPMALASYPGSGNTWVRGLIQTTTGLCTGAIYCDKTLRSNGYPGERLQTAATFMVKTHQVDPRWSGVHYGPNDPFTYFTDLKSVPIYSGGVFIMRNPFDAMVAEFKRQAWVDREDLANHVKDLSIEHFGNNSKWDAFVKTEAQVWEQTVLGWLIANRGHPIHVVKYEQLKLDTKGELEKIMKFLQVPYSRRQLDRVVHAGYSEFKRKHKHVEYYTEAQREYVGDIVRVTSTIITKAGHKPIMDYV